MIKELLTVCATLFLLIEVASQSKPIFIPDQVDNSQELYLKCYCKPGVDNQSRSRGIDVEYQLNSTQFYGNTDEFTFQSPRSKLKYSSELEIKAKVPILNRPGLKLLIGYNYTQEKYSFDEIGIDYSLAFDLLNNNLLKSNAFSIYFSKSLNEKNYLAFRARLLYNGNYDGLVKFRSRYAYYNFIGFLGTKVNDNFEWGIGVSYGSNVDGDDQVIPLFLFNKNFSQKWGIEAVLPSFIFFRNNINSSAMMFYGVEIKGQNYAFDLPNTITPDEHYFIFDHSKVQLVTNLEYKLREWVWLNVKVGYSVAFNTSFESIREEIFTSFETDPTNHPFFKVGLFISPSDSFVK